MTYTPQQLRHFIKCLEHLRISMGISLGGLPERRVGAERRKDPYTRRVGTDPRSGKERRFPNEKITPLVKFK